MTRLIATLTFAAFLSSLAESQTPAPAHAAHFVGFSGLPGLAKAKIALAMRNCTQASRTSDR